MSSLHKTAPILLLLAACQTTVPITDTPVSSTPVTTPMAELRNTRWVLRTLNSQPVPVPTNGEAYMLLRSDALTTEGNAGCNRFRGSFTLPADSQLRFGSLLSTKMACPALSTEAAFLTTLEQTRTYQISGDTLRLFSETDAQPAAILHAVYLR